MLNLIKLALFICIGFGFTSCGDDDSAASTTTTENVMPLPNASCGGNSCIDNS